MTALWWSWIVGGAVAATPWLALALAVERAGRSRLDPRVLHALLVVAALEMVVPVGLVGVGPSLTAPMEASLSASAATGTPAPLGWLPLAAAIWAMGVGTAGLTLASRTRRLRARVTRDGVRDAGIHASVRGVADEVGVAAPDAFLWDDAPGPFVLGVARPLVVVPSELGRTLPPARLRHLLLHELVHLRRRDLWWEGAWATLAVLFWFHPLVHLLRSRARALREACCDAEAARLDRPGPGGYRETLLLVGRSVLAAGPAHAAAVASFARGHELVWRARLLERTRTPASRTRRAAARTAVAVAVVAGLVVGVPPTDSDPVAPVSEGSTIEKARSDAEAALAAHRDGTGGSMQLRNAVFGLRNAARSTLTDSP